MLAPREVIARFDFSIEIPVPRRIAKSMRTAAWLRRLADVIEQGDSPRCVCGTKPVATMDAAQTPASGAEATADASAPAGRSV